MLTLAIMQLALSGQTSRKILETLDVTLPSFLQAAPLRDLPSQKLCPKAIEKLA